MRFIDLFAGLGCFHQALKDLGHECVFACEIDPTLNKLYEKNWNISPNFDIREVDPDQIHDHEILCAGFPCQPFSHATPIHKQIGFDCSKNGDLFSWIVKILRAKKPNYFILENAPFLKNHNAGRTWQTVEKELQDVLGYKINHGIFSPSQFEIPQNRKRLFIVGSLKSSPSLPSPSDCVEADIHGFLEKDPCEPRSLSSREIDCLDLWQEFVEQFPAPTPLPSPIWSREFGASYPFKGTTPDAYGVPKLRRWRGNHGNRLSKLSEEEIWQNLPAYAKRGQDRFPKWKIQYIDNNRKFYRKFYKDRKVWFDEWKQKIAAFPPTWQRFEWNCQTATRNIWNQIIQFRGSGIRVSTTKRIPTLVARTSQVPIIGWKKRYLTPRECARLQSIKDNVILPETEVSAFKSLGNAVNVKVVSEITKALIN